MIFRIMSTQIITDGGTIATVIPLLSDAAIGLNATAGVELPKLQAEIAAAVELDLNASVELPSATAQAFLDTAAQVVVTPPSATISGGASVAADLSVGLSDLELYAALGVYLSGLLLNGGIRATVFEGLANEYSSTGVLPSDTQPSDQTLVISLAVNAGLHAATVVALKTCFGIN